MKTIFAKISVLLPKDKRVRRAGAMAELLYIRCILLAKEILSDGVIDESQLDIAAVGLPGRPRDLAAKLVAVGLWERTDEGWRVPPDKWARWQTTTEQIENIRQKRSEAGKNGANARWQNNGNLPSPEMANATSALMHRDQTTENRDQTTEIRREEEVAVATPSPSSEEFSNPNPSEFMLAWNSEVPFSPIKSMSDARKTALRARRSSEDWRRDWQTALGRIRGSPFLRGENDRNWKAGVDWFLRPDTVTKILEGFYDGGSKANIGDGRVAVDAGAVSKIRYFESNAPERAAASESSSAPSETT